jgi:hypothetical protein
MLTQLQCSNPTLQFRAAFQDLEHRYQARDDAVQPTRDADQLFAGHSWSDMLQLGQRWNDEHARTSDRQHHPTARSTLNITHILCSEVETRNGVLTSNVTQRLVAGSVGGTHQGKALSNGRRNTQR